ncbi:MAG: hypothetical protein Q9162_006064 [Coniocarpon cinnabarinum]
MTKNKLGDTRPQNKLQRQALHQKAKKAKDAQRRDFRMRRKRDEAKDPDARIKRQTKNVPLTLDRKRRWDEIDDAELQGSGLGLSVDVGSLKRQRVDHELLDGVRQRIEKAEKEGLTEDKLKEKDDLEAQKNEAQAGGTGADSEGADAAANEDHESPFTDEANELVQGEAVHSDALEPGTKSGDEDLDEADSLKNGPDEDGEDDGDDIESILQEVSDEEGPDDASKIQDDPNAADNASMASRTPAPSTTSTAISLIPDALSSKFPTLFEQPHKNPKVLITTSLFGTVHREANLLVDLFPNSTYVPRTRHKYRSHHYSLREVAKYASNRDFTTLLVLNEDHKRPSGLTAIHLPSGPTLHFTITNWIPGRRLPGHGRPTDHHPELILNNFRTPLGLLTAHFFRSLFPPSPELTGRQVVTLHNQRDYIFVRRHRYVFRDKRATEKSVTDAETGKAVRGVENVKAGLQELGPRFTLKLRRVDRGIQRVSGQEWEWKAKMEKVRTKFQL